ncbi:2-oxoacid ferredoxin oxidoreductase [Candidatus Falkowbacteria bacterium CG10_big_fil_rev_8_21_14_0_10_43_10]|uniref:2-oxoacid ferredoxin oxidoreductase n=1 Tax=Candidatus Falkowbacteria bacterium CG10_big_fil_rev_8_21_14_0_10_43_10 TaxID=1974567 RepID=A0A2H0V185_9BACT|nr:MAG: 2-oxoacid ferredoxin oxidoreductase [Candidatus Falkowbacteria bacterium CG10_big_fil_rev_8_21_14_0_10_43_10]
MYNTKIKPTFCPGCGNYGIKQALQSALEQLDLKPHQAVITYDVGCNSNMADFIYAYGFHGLHGRSVPSAAGIKLANHKLPVIAIIGDGAFYSEGGTHFLNLMRANHDVTVIVHNNHRFSLTAGQYTSTTEEETITVTSPAGVIEEPVNPIAVSLVNHATFVARGFAGDVKHLTDLIISGVKHKGFSLIDVLQPCVIWNKEQSYEWYKKNIYYLKKADSKRQRALKDALNEKKLAVGVFYQENKPAYHEEFPALIKKPLVYQDIRKIDIREVMKEFG